MNYASLRFTVQRLQGVHYVTVGLRRESDEAGQKSEEKKKKQLNFEKRKTRYLLPIKEINFDDYFLLLFSAAM